MERPCDRRMQLSASSRCAMRLLLSLLVVLVLIGSSGVVADLEGYDPTLLGVTRVGNAITTATSSGYLTGNVCAMLYDVPLTDGVVFGFTALSIAPSADTQPIQILIVRPVVPTRKDMLGFLVQAQFDVQLPPASEATEFVYYAPAPTSSPVVNSVVDTRAGDLMVICGDGLFNKYLDSTVRNVVFTNPATGIPSAFTLQAPRSSTWKFNFQAMIWHGVQANQIDPGALAAFLTQKATAAGDARNSASAITPDPDTASTSDGSVGATKDTVVLILGIMGGIACLSLFLLYVKRWWLYRQSIRRAQVSPASVREVVSVAAAPSGVLVYQPAAGESPPAGLGVPGEAWHPQPPPLIDVSGGWTNTSSKVVQPTSDLELQRIFPRAVYTYKQGPTDGEDAPPPAYAEMFQPPTVPLQQIDLGDRVAVHIPTDDDPPSFRAVPSRPYQPVSQQEEQRAGEAAASAPGVHLHSVYLPTSSP